MILMYVQFWGFSFVIAVLVSFFGPEDSKRFQNIFGSRTACSFCCFGGYRQRVKQRAGGSDF